MIVAYIFKQQAKASFAENWRHIGTFDSREKKAAVAYEVAREKLKIATIQRPLDLKAAKAAARQSSSSRARSCRRAMQLGKSRK